MNDSDVRALVHAAIHRVAPEANLDSVPPGGDFREALDIDSMDFLNFVDDVHARTGIDVPERDYPSLASIDGCVAYLTERWPGRSVTAS
jgi:acyl carrier protein